jgi:RNA polymerase sigma factor (sigma-70 family)
MKEFEKALNNHLDGLLLFARSKINDFELAADVVQDSLLKAVKSKNSLKDETNIRAWLFSILRNSIIDIYRKRAVVKTEKIDPESIALESELDRLACTCIEKLIPTLNKNYAFLVQELELKQRPTTVIAKELNITENNLKVMRYRARQQLKQRLEETCQLCAKHGCVDCTCSA